MHLSDVQQAKRVVSVLLCHAGGWLLLSSGS
jgi:hypothetical protein